MPLSADQILGQMRHAGFRSFSLRKLERWANLGAVPHPKRKGLGRGKGFVYLWSEDALWGALFIEDALRWQKSRRFEDAVLWAWLRGAPVPLGAIRRYLAGGIGRQRAWLERHLNKQRQHGAEEPLDLVDRLSRVFAYKHGTLRKIGTPLSHRKRLMQETLANLIGERWSADGRTAKIYGRADKTILAPLIGIDWNRLQAYFTPTRETVSERRFFNYAELEREARTVPDETLLAARASFAGQMFRTMDVLTRIQSRRRVPSREKARAEDTYRIYSILFQLDPSWVIMLFLYSLVVPGKKKTKGVRGTTNSQR